MNKITTPEVIAYQCGFELGKAEGQEEIQGLKDALEHAVHDRDELKKAGQICSQCNDYLSDEEKAQKQSGIGFTEDAVVKLICASAFHDLTYLSRGKAEQLAESIFAKFGGMSHEGLFARISIQQMQRVGMISYVRAKLIKDYVMKCFRGGQ